MSDQSNEIAFTRRQLLGGVTALGTASAIAGAGSFALFSDDELASGTLSAGTLELVLNGGEVSSPVSFMDHDGLVPGDSGVDTLTLENAGSLPGYLDVHVIDVPTTSGHLADAVEVTVFVDGPNDDLGSKTYLCPNFGGNPKALSSVFVAGETHSLNYKLEPGEGATFALHWEIPASVGNEIQGDSVGLDLEFQFHQTPKDNGTATCEHEPDGDGDDESEDSESEITTTSGTGLARTAMGGWDWATLGRYGMLGRSNPGNSSSDDYEIAFLRFNPGQGEVRIHKANQHLRREWENDRIEPFIVDYDGSRVMTTIGERQYPDNAENSGQGVGASPITQIGVTVVADADGSSATAGNLELDADGLGTRTLESVATDGESSTRHLVAEFAEPLDGSFTLNGDLTFSWDNEPAPDDLELRIDVKTEGGPPNSESDDSNDDE